MNSATIVNLRHSHQIQIISSSLFRRSKYIYMRCSEVHEIITPDIGFLGKIVKYCKVANGTGVLLDYVTGENSIDTIQEILELAKFGCLTFEVSMLYLRSYLEEKPIPFSQIADKITLFEGYSFEINEAVEIFGSIQASKGKQLMKNERDTEGKCLTQDQIKKCNRLFQIKDALGSDNFTFDQEFSEIGNLILKLLAERPIFEGLKLKNIQKIIVEDIEFPDDMPTVTKSIALKYAEENEILGT